MLDILLIYRGRVFDEEIYPQLELYKHDNVVLVVENLIIKNIISRGLIGNIKNRKVITASEYLGGKVDNMGYKNTGGFDFKLGNPPYSIGDRSEGGQNKIYNQISKKTLELPGGGKYDITSLHTPTSVLKKSKRFSLIGQRGLKTVDFTANESFDENVIICEWTVDKNYKDKEVEVISNGGVEYQDNDEKIYDYSKVDKSFTQLYETLKKVTDTPVKRMFRQNNFGPATSKEKDDVHEYTLYKTDKTEDRNLLVSKYSKRIPYGYGKEKFSISMTKAFDNLAIFVGKEDLDEGSMWICLNNTTEVDNIKSFIFSDYFKLHSENWKNVDGYGYNYSLKYLPPFDKTKSWTNEEVKNFFEGFLD